jgi:hypothetical protein
MRGPPGADLLKMIEERFGRRAITPTLFLMAVGFPIVELAVIVAALAVIWTLALAPLASLIGSWISVLTSAPTVAVTQVAVAIAAILLSLFGLAVSVIERRATSRLLDAYLRHLDERAFQ